MSISFCYSSDMNHELLASFVVFADHCNFTRAAKALHISQPALHAQVGKLADSVGVPLYFRDGRDLRLTDDGQRLAAFARDLASRTEDFLAQLRDTEATRAVTLASGEGAYLYLLGRALVRFRKSGKRLQLLTLNAERALEAVRVGHAAAAVTALDELPDDLDAMHLAAIGQMVVVPRTHRLASEEHVTAGDLDGEAIIVSTAGSPHRRSLAQALRLAEATWQPAMEAPGWELMLHFAELGFGVAVVNDFCRVPRGMRGIPLTDLPPIDYYFIERPGDPLADTRALRDAIVSTINR